MRPIRPIRLIRPIFFLLSALLVAGVLIFLFSYFSSKSASAAWYDDDWHFRKILTIDFSKVSGGSNLSNFPVMVSLRDPGLGSKAQSDGDDILFTSSDGTTQLDHEIEKFDSQTGELVAWVEVPTLSASANTVLYMYYGNSSISSQQDATGTWDANTIGVWHLNNNNYNNSTSTANLNGSNTNTTDLANSQIAGGRTFSDSTTDDDYIQISDNNALDITGNITVSAWVRRSGSTGSEQAIVSHFDHNNNEGYYLSWSTYGTDGYEFRVYDGATSHYGRGQNVSNTTNTWYYVVGVYDGATVQVYINGTKGTTEEAAFTGSIQASNDPLRFGISSYSLNYDLIGNMDEVRISNTARSAGWITTSYNNQSDPGSFFSVGGEEKVKEPILYFKFDDGQGTTAQDSSPNNLDGTLNNTPTWQTEDMCVAGKCLWFDGSNNENVSRADNDKLDFVAADNFTVSAWVKRNGASSANNVILGKASANIGSTYQGYKLYQDASGDYCFDTQDGTLAVDTACTSGVDFDDDRWHLVQGVKTGTTSITLYVDGKQRAQDATIASTGSLSNSGIFYVGIDSDGLAIDWKGFIDEVKVYPYARSQAQINADYTSRGSVKGVSAQMGGKDMEYLSEGLVGYWKMDETSGTSVADLSGNSRTGTLTAAQETNTSLTGSSANTIADTNNANLSSTDDAYNGMVLSMSGGSCNVNGDVRTISDYTGSTKTITVSQNFSATPDTLNCTYTVLHQVGGKFSQGLQFEPATTTRDYVSATLAGLIDTGTSSFTLSTWIKRTGSFTSGGQVFGKQGYDAGLGTTGNAIRCSITNTSNNIFNTTASSALTLNQWYHATCVYEANTGKVSFYLDGRLIGSNTLTGSVYNYSDTIYFGGNPVASHSLVLDEARVYSRALSEKEVRDLYNFAPGPSGYWNLDERSGTTANDTSDNAYVSSAFTGNTAWTNGKYGGGLLFDGDGDVARIVEGTNIDLGATTDSYTVEGWIKTTTDYSGNTSVVAKDDGSGAYPLELYLNSSEYACFDVSDGTNTPSSCGATALNDGKWHHLTGVRDVLNDKTYLYVDGIQITSTTDSTTATAANNDDVSVGNAGTSYVANDFNGSIDDVRIYNYARSAKQIVQDMNAGHPAVGSPVGSTVAHWKFDEGALNTCSGGTNDFCDSTPNGNDLAFSTTTGGFTNAGKFGKALNGTGAVWASRADDADFDVTDTDDYSVSLWFKSDSTTNPVGSEYLFNKANATTAGYAVYTTTNGYLCFGIDDDTTWGPDISSCNATDLYDQTWHHLVAVRDHNGTDKTLIYIDGVLQDSDSDSTTATLANTLTLYIGDRDGTDNGDEFTGDIDEVKVYRYALNSDDVKTEYNRGSSIVLGTTFAKDDLPANLSNGLVAYWKMDESSGTTVSDSSGNSLNLTTQNMEDADWTGGKYGHSLSFDGSNEFASINNNSLLEPNNDMTFSAWVKTVTATPGEAGAIVKITHSASPWKSYALYQSAGNAFTFQWINTSGTTYQVSSSLSPSVSTWYQIVGVKRGGELRIYVNGYHNSATVGAPTGTLYDANGTFTIGAGSATQERFNGSIDDVKLYNRALSDNEIEQLYFWTSKAVGEWNFEEKTGTTANDRGGSGNNLTVTGPSWSSGKIGAGLSFDGSNDYATIADDADFDFVAADNFSVSAWVKHDGAIATNPDYIITKADNSGPGYKLYMESDGDLCFDVDSDATWGTDQYDSACTSGTNYADGKWHYVSGVKTGSSSIELFIDGYSKASDSSIAATNTLVNSNALYIGIDRDGTSNGWDGWIDEVKIHNYARLPLDILWEYNKAAPVLYWKLDECQGTTANDSSGNSNSGTINIGATGEDTVGDCNTSSTSWGSGATGKINYSLDFDGADDNISLADDADLDFLATEDFTVSAWVKHDGAIATNPDYIITKADNPGPGYKIYMDNDGDLCFGIDDDATAWNPDIESCTSGANFDDSAWHHVVGIRDYSGTDKTYLYVDGKLRDSDSDSTTATLANTNAFYAGVDRDGTSNEWDGQIDDIRVYRYALQPSQIRTLYNNGAVNFAPLTGAP